MHRSLRIVWLAASLAWPAMAFAQPADAPPHHPPAYVPAHLKQGSPSLPQREEQRSMTVDATPLDIDFDITGEAMLHGESGYGGGCGPCGDCCLQLPQICLPSVPRENLSLFAGVLGFKGPVNRGSDGSFGFTEGLNWGVPLPFGDGGYGGQLGIRGVQSNFHGADFTSDQRTQFYLTAGLFRRADRGLQFGGVVDFQHDDWYAQSNLAQFRGEVSWVNGCASEIGFMLAGGGGEARATAALRDDQNLPFTIDESRQTTDYYALFYRHRLDCGAGDWRVYGGFTDDSEGMVGADAELAISSCWSLQSGVTYVVPSENNVVGGSREEAWNVGIQLAFHPWGGARKQGNYHRPLLNVADNGSFLVDIQ